MRHSSYILELYRRVMCRRSLYRFNKALYFLSLKGIGIGNWQSADISGEKRFVSGIASRLDTPVVLDIGANVGNYSNLLKELSPRARIFAFEPHPLTFAKLQLSAQLNGYVAVNAACGSVVGKAKLFDHGNHETGTEHASMIKDVIESVHSDKSKAWDIDVTTIDDFVKVNGLVHIDLLKIDVEGGEMNVLLGAAETMAAEMIDYIHFEFTEANTVSRVFMKDFYALLEDFDFYRMLPDGLGPMGSYFPLLSEIFAYQNVVAIRKGVGSCS